MKNNPLYLFIILYLVCNTGCFVKYHIFPSIFGFITIEIIVPNEQINDGIILPVDIIIVKNTDQILELSPDDWFVSSERETLTDNELYRLAVKNGDSQRLKIKIKPDIERLIIYADYDIKNDFNSQRVIFPVEKFRYYYSVFVGKYKIE